MTPSQIIELSSADGVTLILTMEGEFKARGQKINVDKWLTHLTQNKSAIIKLLQYSIPEHDWLHTLAMNSTEFKRFCTRVDRFTNRGSSKRKGADDASRLTLRDRDSDTRTTCGECNNLISYEAGNWACSNWQKAEISLQPFRNQIGEDFVNLLQHCPGFNLNINSETI